MKYTNLTYLYCVGFSLHQTLRDGLSRGKTPSRKGVFSRQDALWWFESEQAGGLEIIAGNIRQEM